MLVARLKLEAHSMVACIACSCDMKHSLYKMMCITPILVNARGMKG